MYKYELNQIIKINWITTLHFPSDDNFSDLGKEPIYKEATEMFMYFDQGELFTSLLPKGLLNNLCDRPLPTLGLPAPGHFITARKSEWEQSSIQAGMIDSCDSSLRFPFTGVQ